MKVVVKLTAVSNMQLHGVHSARIALSRIRLHHRTYAHFLRSGRSFWKLVPFESFVADTFLIRPPAALLCPTPIMPRRRRCSSEGQESGKATNDVAHGQHDKRGLAASHRSDLVLWKKEDHAFLLACDRHAV
jgi:hypothetical protein